IKDIGGKGAYAPGIWQTTQLAGQNGTFAIPWFTEARAIYYRKDVHEKAGIDPATAFKDWDSFQQTLQTIKDKVPTINGKPIAPFGSPGKKAFDLLHHVMPFVWDAGGAELSADDKKSTIDSPQAEEGVNFMAGLIQKGLYDKSMLERDGTQVDNQTQVGRLLVRRVGREPVQGRPPRRVDRRPVGPRLGRAHRRHELGLRGAQERRRRPDAGRPVRQGLHVRRRLEPHDVQVDQASQRGVGTHEVPVRGRGPEGVREPHGHVPGASRAAEAGRRDRSRPQGVLQRDPAGADVRADPAV